MSIHFIILIIGRLVIKHLLNITVNKLFVNLKKSIQILAINITKRQVKFPQNKSMKQIFEVQYRFKEDPNYKKK